MLAILFVVDVSVAKTQIDRVTAVERQSGIIIEGVEPVAVVKRLKLFAFIEGSREVNKALVKAV